MGKEIAELKQQQIQNKSPAVATTIPKQPPSPQVLMNPYTQALLMNPHLAPHQQ